MCIDCLLELAKYDENISKMLKITEIFTLISNILDNFHYRRKKCLQLTNNCLDLLNILCIKFNATHLKYLNSLNNSLKTSHNNDHNSQTLAKLKSFINEKSKITNEICKTLYQIPRYFYNLCHNNNNNDSNNQRKKDSTKYIEDIDNYFNIIIVELCYVLRNFVNIQNASNINLLNASSMSNADIITMLCQILNLATLHHKEQFINICNKLFLYIVCIFEELCALNGKDSEWYIQSIANYAGSSLVKFIIYNINDINTIYQSLIKYDQNNNSSMNSQSSINNINHIIKENINEIIFIITKYY